MIMETLNYCYHHSDFKFSAEAEKWVRDTYYYPYLDRFVTYDKYSTANSEKNILNKKITWQGTAALEELRDYLATWGVARDYIGSDLCGPDVFISNSQKQAQPGWPHIDGYKWDDNDPTVRLPVLTRFNVVIEYNPDDPMHWWEDVVRGHELVGSYTQLHNGIKNHQYLAIKGDHYTEKWKYLGTPSTTKTALYKNHQAAFLRTDCAHCLDITKPGFRLVVALALDCTLAELYKRKGLL
jgi:hypothetical protein